jgi:predicted MFS family arabinose efflux permease
MLSMGGMALSLALWPLGSNLLLTTLVLVPWALGCFAANSAQQARLSGISPLLASGSIALNTSAIYAGQAVGAASGGWLIALGQMRMLHWAGLAGMGLALLVSWLATRAARQAPGHPMN